jgi:hypothetical protein
MLVAMPSDSEKNLQSMAAMIRAGGSPTYPE